MSFKQFNNSFSYKKSGFQREGKGMYMYLPVFGYAWNLNATLKVKYLIMVFSVHTFFRFIFVWHSYYKTPGKYVVLFIIHFPLAFCGISLSMMESNDSSTCMRKSFSVHSLIMFCCEMHFTMLASQEDISVRMRTE